MKQKNYLSTYIAIFLVVIILSMSFFTVKAGFGAVVLTFGKASETTYAPGFHLKIPLVQRVIKMEIRTQKIELPTDSSSKDLQDVQTTIALNSHLQPDKVHIMYSTVGTGYHDRIVYPAIEEVVKAVTARYTAEELITKRPSVRMDIEEGLAVKLGKYNVVVDGVNIVDFQFSEEFDKAIELKVTAEQLKLKADRDLERIKVEAEQRITRAKAEAEALRLQKAQITPELVQLRNIEMMQMAIEKWDGVMPQATSGMPFIDVSPKKLE